MLNRRHFFGRGSVLAASAVGAPWIARSATEPARPGQRPRHIIHIVSDGMSAGTLSCADQLSLRLRGRGLTWLKLCNQPGSHLGLMETRSLNSLVTDSAAASSSWGSGVRVNNGTVNQSSKDKPLKTLYELFAQAGWKRGLVTTAEITHATPAGFATSVKKRGMATTIASQYLQREIDVLLGGGAKFFEASYRLDGKDLFGAFAKAGYRILRTPAELAVAPTDARWLGTFAASHLPYALDHIPDAKLRADVPTLATMTAAALRRLEKENHFILQVEGARIDHACHNNDAAAALHDQIALDEAIDACVEFQKRVPDTLLVLTTDHGNANLGLNGTGDSYADSSKVFQNLKEVKSSFVTLLRPLKRRTAEEPPEKELDEEAEKKKEAAKSATEKEREATRKKKEEENVATPTEIVELVQAATGYKMPYRKAELLRLHLSNAGEALYDVRKSDVSALGDVLSNHLGIGFTGTSHTSDHVPVLAVGPGAEHFHGFIKNTDVFRHYLGLAKIDFRNPDEPLVAGGPSATEVERHGDYQWV
ncbi:MAG: alkaline phosphatase [Verrucomicrobiales bacterium]|nr:alkaline phosphatase [Verrucomicrobiales bacterium]